MDFSLGGREITGVFRICYNNQTGTAFLFYTEKGGLFVTAAHVLQGAQAGDNVLLMRDNDWLPRCISDILFDVAGHDVVVFCVEGFAVTKLLPPYKDSGLLLGDPVKFLGFPHGLTNTYPGNGYPAPLVRHAHFSGVIVISGAHVIVLDGFNNPGYSGGPVYVRGEDGNPTIYGVITGYRRELPTHGSIYRKNELGEEEALPDVYVKSNSGMIYASSIDAVIKLAAKMNHLIPAAEPLI